MYERVLVPTDGSEGSAHAAMRGIDLAEQYGGTVYGLHVVSDDLRSLVEGVTSAADVTDRGRHAVERVEAIAEAHGVEAVTELREGDPAREILDYADEIGADVIVAGTHGRSGIERRLIGSVAERLVRHAACPVLSVRLPETDVTVGDADHAESLAATALTEEGYDAEIAGSRRQTHLWVVDADTDGGSLLVYVDPVTQRTSIVPRT